MKSWILCLASASLFLPSIVEAQNNDRIKLQFEVDCTSIAIMSVGYDNPRIRSIFSKNPFLIIDRNLTFKRWSDISWKTAVKIYESGLDEEDLDYITSEDYESFMNPIQEESMKRLMAELDSNGSFDRHYKQLETCVSILGK